MHQNSKIVRTGRHRKTDRAESQIKSEEKKLRALRKRRGGAPPVSPTVAGVKNTFSAIDPLPDDPASFPKKQSKLVDWDKTLSRSVVP